MRSADEEDGDDLANPDDEEDHREVTHPDDFPDVDDPEAAGSAPSDADNDDADDADNDNDDAGADDNDADNGDANDGADGDARLPRPPSASGPSVGTTTEDDAADEVALKGRLALVLDLAHDGFDDDSSDDDGGDDDGGDDDNGGSDDDEEGDGEGGDGGDGDDDDGGDDDGGDEDGGGGDDDDNGDDDGIASDRSNGDDAATSDRDGARQAGGAVGGRSRGAAARAAKAAKRARAAPKAKRAKVPQHVTVTVDGTARRLHKTRFMNELNALRPGTALSNDRLKRVSHHSIEHVMITGDADGNGEDSDMLGIGQDFAMAFEDPQTKKHVAWYGRVTRMKSIERGKRQLWRRPFRLDDDPDMRPLVEVYARWYSEPSRNAFKYDVDDSKPYLVKYIVSLVTMARCARTATYSIATEARRAVDIALEQLDEDEEAAAAEQAGQARRGRKRAGAAVAAAAPAAAEPSAATRQTTAGAPTKSGRRTTVVVNADADSATARSGSTGEGQRGRGGRRGRGGPRGRGGQRGRAGQGGRAKSKARGGR